MWGVIGTLRSVMARGDRWPDRESRPKRRILLVVAVAVPVALVVGLIAWGTRGGPEPKAPASAQAMPSAPAVAPETHPTRGEYVPPRPSPARTREPRPAERPRTAPSKKPERRAERECPRDWSRVPFLRRWCERNGFRTR
ncbi:hypothetical protein GCM10023085_12680 [Actinomadura viridis]